MVRKALQVSVLHYRVLKYVSGVVYKVPAGECVLHSVLKYVSDGGAQGPCRLSVSYMTVLIIRLILGGIRPRR